MEQLINLNERLIEQCKQGDERAQFALYKQYVQAMYNAAYRVVGNQFDAEDVVQDAFIKAFKKISSLKEYKAFGTWLKQIVINESISLIRRQKRLKISVESLDSVTDYEEDDDNIALPINKVMEEVLKLPEGARVVFTLRVIEEYKFREIAQLTGHTENNCKVQFHRAKKILNNKLKSTIYA